MIDHIDLPVPSSFRSQPVNSTAVIYLRPMLGRACCDTSTDYHVSRVNRYVFQPRPGFLVCDPVDHYKNIRMVMTKSDILHAFIHTSHLHDRCRSLGHESNRCRGTEQPNRCRPSRSIWGWAAIHSVADKASFQILSSYSLLNAPTRYQYITMPYSSPVSLNDVISGPTEPISCQGSSWPR